MTGLAADERPLSAPEEPAGRAYRALLADLAHDLRNPLAVVRGGAQLLNRRLSRPGSVDPATIREGLVQIEDASARMTLLLDDLLDAVAVGAGGQPVVALRPTDLVRLARQAAARYRSTTERHVIRVASDADTLVGFWDPGRLERVFANLLSNALKFSPDGGEIVVEVQTHDGWAELSVSDQGLGIPAAEVDRVFDPFHRCGNVVGVVAGTGLGLPGVRQIVEAHGGSIAVETREGAGTTFRIRLPTAPQPASDPSP
jgi:two-component system sensor histidine kinase MtrB